MGKKNSKEALADQTDQLVCEIIKSPPRIVLGGSPCQDNSVGNTSGEGFDGARSGLVWAMVRTLRLVRPDFWVLENVPEALRRGMGRVFGRLAILRYDAEWDCISAGAAGAPHHRARIYVVAHNPSCGVQGVFAQPIQGQPEFEIWKNCRSLEDVLRRPDIPEPTVRRANDGIAKRLHGIGNGNPPCIIREILRGLV